MVLDISDHILTSSGHVVQHSRQCTFQLPTSLERWLSTAIIASCGSIRASIPDRAHPVSLFRHCHPPW